ncbi:MAG: pyrroline-5-carboxylate reductase [Firmicutes bacterium]|nr:pyrroline-5-carboxylate reductase [Bacillota bacterium]
MLLRGRRLSIIGAGQMGEALVRGFIQSGVLEAEQIKLSDVNVERLESLKAKYQANFTTDNHEAVKDSDIILLAVKPQQIEQVLTETKNLFSEDKLVISIAAGVTTKKINNLIGKRIAVIRVMPNTPALVGQGMSVISRGKYASDEAVKIALLLFSSIGEVIELSEELQNQATAISGSGPAYFFLMVESLIEAGVRAGLEEDVAQKLVVQTMAGSAALLQRTGKKADELREMVTSPGGTTEAALRVFSKREFRYIVQEAVNAAIKRAEELA